MTSQQRSCSLQTPQIILNKTIHTQSQPIINTTEEEKFRYVSPWIRPYLYLARLDKPIGTWLLLLPCGWGAAFAAGAGAIPSPTLALAFIAGAVAMRGAGCVVNDMWDVKYDKMVERTKTRPLAAGTLTMKQAAGFLAAQCMVGLATLPVIGGLNTAAIAFASLPFVVVYPLMKRFTNWPQAVLGITFNWGIYVGYASVQNAVDLSVLLPLHIAGVAWTIFYDTIYAHQDKTDDVKIGVKSTALHFGDNTTQILAVFGAITVVGLAVAGYNNNQTLPYYLVAVLGPALHFLWQLKTVDYSSRASCMAKFISNKNVGLLVLAGICLGNLMKPKMIETDGVNTQVSDNVTKHPEYMWKWGEKELKNVISF